MTSCIDLKERFGHDYQIAFEDTYLGDGSDHARRHDPWLAIISCRLGHVYPLGGEWLAASTNNRGPVANSLAALPGARVIQDGDDGINVAFHVRDFEAVAAIMKPRRRRRLTAAKRSEQVERLRNYQFTSATQTAGNELRRDSATSVDSEHQPAGLRRSTERTRSARPGSDSGAPQKPK